MTSNAKNPHSIAKAFLITLIISLLLLGSNATSSAQLPTAFSLPINDFSKTYLKSKSNANKSSEDKEAKESEQATNEEQKQNETPEQNESPKEETKEVELPKVPQVETPEQNESPKEETKETGPPKSPKIENPHDNNNKNEKEKEHKDKPPSVIYTPPLAPIDPYPEKPSQIITPFIENNTNKDDTQNLEPTIEEENDNIKPPTPDEPKKTPEPPNVIEEPTQKDEPLPEDIKQHPKAPPVLPNTTNEPSLPSTIEEPKQSPALPSSPEATVNETCSCTEEQYENPLCEEYCTEQATNYSNYDYQQLEITKGSTIAITIPLNASNKIRVDYLTDKIKEQIKSITLTDSNGVVFNVGFAIFSTFSDSTGKEYKYYSFDSQATELTSIIKIPLYAAEGNAKVSILSDNGATINVTLKIAEQKDIKIGKRKIGLPKIREPIIAQIIKSNNGKTQLRLIIKGRNFIKKIAVINGELQKIIDKTSFFTNINFQPSKGIKIKEFEVTNSEELILIADIDENNITPGIKFFNVITPKGSDVGAIIIPDLLKEGKLTSFATVEDLGPNSYGDYINSP